MRGIAITGQGKKESFREFFEGSDLDIAWNESPEQVPEGLDFIIDLTFTSDPQRIKTLTATSASLILINAVTPTLSSLGTDDRFVRFNGWNTFIGRPLVELVAAPPLMPMLEKLLASWKKQAEWLPDVVGMPGPRIVAMLVNEAFFALEDRVGTKEAIDVAMKGGTHYPFGPFEWSDKIGPSLICDLLEALQKINSLYKVAPLLREAAHPGFPYGPIAQY